MKQNLVIKTASDVNSCFVLAIYTLCDLVTNHPVYVTINFEQIYH